MNVRLLIILLAFFIGINLVLFAISQGFSFKLLQPKTQTNQTNSLSTILPVDLNHRGIRSTVLIYNFTGKIINIEPVGSNYRWTLDISDNSLPEFLVNDNTTIVRSRDENLTKVDLSSIKIGANVTIGMIYDLRTKTWSLNTVTITLTE